MNTKLLSGSLQEEVHLGELEYNCVDWTKMFQDRVWLLALVDKLSDSIYDQELDRLSVSFSHKSFTRYALHIGLHEALDWPGHYE
jgi:hypothetical protein